MREEPLPFAARWYAVAVSVALNGPEEKRAAAREVIAEFGEELCEGVRARPGRNPQRDEQLRVALGPLARELLAERLAGDCRRT